MTSLSETEFNKLVSEAIDNIPQRYLHYLNNVAFIVEDEPSLKQRQKLGLARQDLLFGLYEGVPLPQRGGATKLLPDKITLFKKHLELTSRDPEDLKKRIANTIWHEVAHFYGLEHGRIYELERHKRKAK